MKVPFYVFVLCDVFRLVSSDPCVSYSYLWDDGGRSVQCGTGTDNCDRYIDLTWYHVINSAGSLRMPTSDVTQGSCGAVYPIWMNDSYPDVDEGIVDRTVCVSGYQSSCIATYTIQVKNCSSFFAFSFARPDGCPERYCFGEDPCPTTTAPVTTTTTTTQGQSVTTIPETTPVIGAPTEEPSRTTIMLVVTLVPACVYILLTIVYFKFIKGKCSKRPNSVGQPQYPSDKQNGELPISFFKAKSFLSQSTEELHHKDSRQDSESPVTA